MVNDGELELKSNAVYISDTQERRQLGETSGIHEIEVLGLTEHSLLDVGRTEKLLFISGSSEMPQKGSHASCPHLDLITRTIHRCRGRDSARPLVGGLWEVQVSADG